MKKTAKQLLSAALCITFILCTGCTGKNTANDASQKEETSAQQEIESPKEPNDEKDSVDVIEEKPSKPEYVNPLTGLECTKQVYENRPTAIMMNNIKQALPQIGIANADVVYEVLEEGGITRLMALFKDYADIPELGSIRSARDYYIDLSDAHDAIYVHCGGSTYAKAMISSRKTEDVDGLYMGNFYRSKERLKTMAYEHTLMISGEGLAKNIENKGYRTTSDAAQPIKFSETAAAASGETAKHIEIPFSLALQTKPYALSTLDYDETVGVYLKGQYGQKHIDGATGEQLSFTNVISLECDQHVISGDALGCLAVSFTGTGKGYYAYGGKIREIVWKKPSRTEVYSLYESDGETPLTLSPGKSYIAIVPTGTTISFS